MKLEEMKQRLEQAVEALTDGLGEYARSDETPWGDVDAAATCVICSVASVLRTAKTDIEGGGFEGFLHGAAWGFEDIALEAMGAAERALVPIVKPETSGWTSGIHGRGATKGDGVVDWPDAPARAVARPGGGGWSRGAKTEDLKRRLAQAARELAGAGCPENRSALTPWGDATAAATWVILHVVRPTLEAMRDDLEEDGASNLLRYAAYMWEGAALDAMGAAERARVPILEPETTGWTSGIHGWAPTKGAGVFDWPDSPVRVTGTGEQRE